MSDTCFFGFFRHQFWCRNGFLFKFILAPKFDTRNGTDFGVYLVPKGTSKTCVSLYFMVIKNTKNQCFGSVIFWPHGSGSIFGFWAGSCFFYLDRIQTSHYFSGRSRIRFHLIRIRIRFSFFRSDPDLLIIQRIRNNAKNHRKACH